MKKKLFVLCLAIIFAFPRSVLATGKWGEIANNNHQNEKIASSLFFAGPPNPNALPNYTRHPLDSANSEWTEQSIQFSLNQMKQVGINTIQLSYWGHDGETDNWAWI